MNVQRIITINTDIPGSQPVFSGTCVLVESLFDQLEAGISLEDFLIDYPAVSKEQVIALLEDTLPFGNITTKTS